MNLLLKYFLIDINLSSTEFFQYLDLNIFIPKSVFSLNSLEMLSSVPSAPLSS